MLTESRWRATVTIGAKRFALSLWRQEPRNETTRLRGGSKRPAGAEKIEDLAITILPKIRSLVKLEILISGNGDVRPVIMGSPFRRVSDPEGKSCLSNSYGAPWRRRRAQSCRRSRRSCGRLTP